MTAKCQLCKKEPAAYAMQFVGEETPTFYLLGWHVRGFKVTKVCDHCRAEQSSAFQPNAIVDKLIEDLITRNPNRSVLGGVIIPLDDFHSGDWIQYKIMTIEFRTYFRNHPEGETETYTWFTRKMDDLWNLRLFKKGNA